MNKRVQKYREQLYTDSREHHPVLAPIRVTIALVSRWGPWDSFERINRPVFSFNLVTKGTMDYRQQGKEGTVGRGEVFIAQKGKDQIFKTGDSGFLHKRSILLDGIGVDALMQVTGLTAVDRVVFERPTYVTALFRRCYRLMRDKPSGFATEVSVIVYAIINECCGAIAAKHPPAVRAAVEFMEQNLKANPSLEEIAAAAGLSVRTCNRVFTSYLHDSPLSFFIGLKLNAAKALLMHTSLSIKQVGLEVGYEDQFHFSAQFKKRTGCGPREFRLRHQKIKTSEVPQQGARP